MIGQPLISRILSKFDISSDWTIKNLFLTSLISNPKKENFLCVCEQLKDVYSADEINHVLGILDVNSVAIHASQMVELGAHNADARPGIGNRD